MYLMDKHGDVVKNTKLSGEYVQVRLEIMREFISMGPIYRLPTVYLKILLLGFSFLRRPIVYILAVVQF